MSDADDSDFDKEAERERLREKYEAEQADREAAQQMSDLLLKGATMTNSHCGQCGSPIFRSDGQEFCPSCSQQGGQGADAAEAGAAQSGADAATAQAGTDAGGGQTDATPGDQNAADPSPDERLRDVVSGNADAADASAEPANSGGTSIAERAAASVQSSGSDAPSQSANDVSNGGASPGSQPAGSAQAGAAPAGGDASLADAQQSLLNAITHHARAATGADPRTAADHLEAANEAAEALATISQQD